MFTGWQRQGHRGDDVQSVEHGILQNHSLGWIRFSAAGGSENSSASKVHAFGKPGNLPEGAELRTDHGPQYTGAGSDALCAQ